VDKLEREVELREPEEGKRKGLVEMWTNWNMKSQPNKNQKEQVKEQVNEAKQDLLERFKVATATWHLTEIFCIDADVDITAQMVEWCQSTYPLSFEQTELEMHDEWMRILEDEPQKREALCFDDAFWTHVLRLAGRADRSAPELLRLIRDPSAALPGPGGLGGADAGAVALAAPMADLVDRICLLLVQVPTSRLQRDSSTHDGCSMGASSLNTSSTFLSTTADGGARGGGDGGLCHAWKQWHERCKLLLTQLQSADHLHTGVGAAGRDLGRTGKHMALQKMGEKLQLLLRLMCGESEAMKELVEEGVLDRWADLLLARLLYAPELLQLRRYHVHQIMDDCRTMLGAERNAFEDNFLTIANFDVTTAIKIMYGELNLPWAAAHLAHLVEEAARGQKEYSGRNPFHGITGPSAGDASTLDCEYTELLWLKYCEGLWRSGGADVGRAYETWRLAVPYLLSPCCPTRGAALVRAMVARSPVTAGTAGPGGGSSISDKDVDKLLLLIQRAGAAASTGTGSGACAAEGSSLQIAMCLARGQHWLHSITALEKSTEDRTKMVDRMVDAGAGDGGPDDDSEVMPVLVRGQGAGMGLAFRWFVKAAQTESDAALEAVLDDAATRAAGVQTNGGGAALLRHFDVNSHTSASRRLLRLVAALLHRNLQLRPKPSAEREAEALAPGQGFSTQAVQAASATVTSAGAGVQVVSIPGREHVRCYLYDRQALQTMADEISAVVKAIMPPTPAPAPISSADIDRLHASAEAAKRFAGAAAGSSVMAAEAEAASGADAAMDELNATQESGSSLGRGSAGGGSAGAPRTPMQHPMAASSAARRQPDSVNAAVWQAGPTQKQSEYAAALLQARVREERLLFAGSAAQSTQLPLAARQPVTRYLQRFSELLLVLVDVSYVADQQVALRSRFEELTGPGAGMTGAGVGDQADLDKLTAEWTYSQQCMVMLHQQVAARIIEALEARLPHPHEHYTKQFWHYLLTMALPLLPLSLAEGQKRQRGGGGKQQQRRRRQQGHGGGVPYCVFGHRQSLVLLECLSHINTTAARSPQSMAQSGQPGRSSASGDGQTIGDGMQVDGGDELTQSSLTAAATRNMLRTEITKAISRSILVASQQ
jgi:hypothetical protein